MSAQSSRTGSPPVLAMTGRLMAMGNVWVEVRTDQKPQAAWMGFAVFGRSHPAQSRCPWGRTEQRNQLALESVLQRRSFVSGRPGLAGSSERLGVESWQWSLQLVAVSTLRNHLFCQVRRLGCPGWNHQFEDCSSSLVHRLLGVCLAWVFEQEPSRCLLSLAGRWAPGTACWSVEPGWAVGPSGG